MRDPELEATAVYVLQVYALGVASRDKEFLSRLEPEMFCDSRIEDLIVEMKRRPGKLPKELREWLALLGCRSMVQDNVVSLSESIVEKLTWDARFARAAGFVHRLIEGLDHIVDPALEEKVGFVRELWAYDQAYRNSGPPAAVNGQIEQSPDDLPPRSV